MKTNVYVGVSNRTGGEISGLLRRTADSDQWSLAPLPTDTHVHAITVHPDDPAIVYAAARSTSMHLYRVRNAG